MWITLTERQSRKSRSPKAVFVFGSLRAGEPVCALRRVPNQVKLRTLCVFLV